MWKEPVDGAGSANGTDVVVEVNGQQVTGDGNQVEFKSDTLQVTFEVADGFTGEADTFTVSGDALKFLFSPNVSETASLALLTVSTARLGGSAGRLDSLRGGASAGLASGNFAEAIAILDVASDQIVPKSGRGRRV